MKQIIGVLAKPNDGEPFASRSVFWIVWAIVIHSTCLTNSAHIIFIEDQASIWKMKYHATLCRPSVCSEEEDPADGHLANFLPNSGCDNALSFLLQIFSWFYE